MGYIETIMKRFAAERMEEVMPKKPMDRKVGMISGEESSKEPFRELLGALLFVAICTRPDVAFAVAILCKYTQQAKERNASGPCRCSCIYMEQDRWG